MKNDDACLRFAYELEISLESGMLFGESHYPTLHSSRSLMRWRRQSSFPKLTSADTYSVRVCQLVLRSFLFVPATPLTWHLPRSDGCAVVLWERNLNDTLGYPFPTRNISEYAYRSWRMVSSSRILLSVTTTNSSAQVVSRYRSFHFSFPKNFYHLRSESSVHVLWECNSPRESRYSEVLISWSDK